MCFFLSSRYYRGLPRYYRAWSVRYYQPNAVLPPGEAILPLWCGPSAQAVLPRCRRRVGIRTGTGGSNFPIPIRQFPPLRLSLSRSRTGPESLAGSPSPAALLGFRPVGSFPTTSSCHGPRFFPKSLSFLLVLLSLGFWGDACVLEILGQIFAREGCRRVVLHRNYT